MYRQAEKPQADGGSFSSCCLPTAPRPYPLNSMFGCDQKVRAAPNQPEDFGSSFAAMSVSVILLNRGVFFFFFLLA